MCSSWRTLIALIGFFAAAAATGQQVYEIDVGSSEIYWRVYKAGALRGLGHNHAISATRFQGRVIVDDVNPLQSRFELTIPVTELVVDDPALRASLGSDFSRIPKAADIAGTRKNMLSPIVLHGDKFPVIRVSGAGWPGTAGAEQGQTMDVVIELLGRSVALQLPAAVVISDRTVEARGEFELGHGDLGMRPFSVMLGALKVAETLRFSYRIVARR